MCGALCKVAGTHRIGGIEGLNQLKQGKEMEISIALFVLIGVAVIILWTHISEIHTKLDILLQNNDIKWE